ncbi:MAG TPA: efflux RND transporter periplasmic adaptor subunit [Tenuifilaceae bacterium]|nr:efflux RND transporter periplasmic adaptor subunit [Tenuifilaceae bacterium]
MKRLFILIFSITIYGCSHTADSSAGAAHQHDESSHEAEAGDDAQTFTIYTSTCELFAEAKPFVVGTTTTVLSHFTNLADFKPLTSAAITIKLTVNGKEYSQTIAIPEKNGIYPFTVTPDLSGQGQLVWIVERDGKSELFDAGLVRVFANEHEAKAFHAEHIPADAIRFTKEQSWQVDFSTEWPCMEAIGEVIKTTARVEPAPTDEMIISAKTGGIVSFYSSKPLVLGQHVERGDKLLEIVSSGLANEDLSVRYAEAKSNFERAKSNYERILELSKSKVASEKELGIALNEYQNASSTYTNLKENFSASGQNVSSPIDGYVQDISVQNGEYVEAGQPVLTVFGSRFYVLNAGVQQKYFKSLEGLKTATVKQANGSYVGIDKFNGRIMSVGNSALAGNGYLIPVIIQVDATDGLVVGSFVELNLIAKSDSMLLTVPTSAILEEQGNYYVLVQLNPETFEKRQVQLGVSDGLRVEIRSGLLSTERVVTRGAVLVKLAQVSGKLDAHAGHVH